MSALAKVLAAIDSVHAEDPNQAELLYAERMTAWLDKLAPDASPELQIAVRAQHLKRWELMRSDYPDGVVGYKKWRAEQARRHAALTTKIMLENGFDEAAAARVTALIQKQRLKQDADAQTLEDCACLVFLEHEFAAFAAKHPPEKVDEIVKKTWAKMSLVAHSHAKALLGNCYILDDCG
jgi:hypothetical protein